MELDTSLQVRFQLSRAESPLPYTGVSARGISAPGHIQLSPLTAPSPLLAGLFMSFPGLDIWDCLNPVAAPCLDLLSLMKFLWTHISSLPRAIWMASLLSVVLAAHHSTQEDSENQNWTKFCNAYCLIFSKPSWQQSHLTIFNASLKVTT